MAKKPPPEHTKWKQGDPSPNPGGRPKNALTQDKVKGMIGQFAQLTESEIRKIADDEDEKWDRRSVAKHMLKAMDDQSELEFIYQRSVGKVKEVKEHHVVPKPTVVTRRDGTQIVLGAEMKQIEGVEE